jgi:hypothetical protein
MSQNVALGGARWAAVAAPPAPAVLEPQFQGGAVVRGQFLGRRTTALCLDMTGMSCHVKADGNT